MADRYLLVQIVPLLDASIYILDEDGVLEEEIQGTSRNSPGGMKELAERTEKDFPNIEVDNEGISVCSMWDSNARKYIVTGKVCLYGYYRKEDVYIPYCPKEKYTSVILLIWKDLSGTGLGRGELWQKNILLEEDVVRVMTNNIFRFQEEGVPRNSYAQELREQDCIRRGDIEGLQGSIDEARNGEAGKTSSDPVRNCKNTAVYVINSAARSAIEGGLSPEMAFIMSDTFIKNIEDNIDIPLKIEQAVREAEFTFAREVQGINRKGSSNPLIIQVKDYVFEHIHDNILIRDIAKSVGVSPNYLSEQFKTYEGITLKQYIINEKIKNSEYLLKYTEYSLQEISSVCAFSSQSRFCDYFQRKNGITPLKYRKKYKKR